MFGNSIEERNEFIDLVAQAVIDKIEEREQLQRVADLVIERVLALQDEDAATAASATSCEGPNVSDGG